ncbi:transcription factor-like 5 protein [Gouania willdenowi]|uniref:BHLH domain-containing protein n=1 Tax=Gouania willdenowi TaxID=441366 RepID=A0A8C5DL78_GOUWI|nr:transcription factor-like 5 protein [Gouania willdenowi]XP_028308355.1 transcription factor-like 5 protein [Gouania willdenowi]
MSGHDHHPGLMEMTDGHGFEVWAKIETHSGFPEGPDTRSPSFRELDQNAIEEKLVSPYTAPSHPIDLTTASDHHYVESFGQKTPLSHGDVPGYVLARMRDEECPPALHPPPQLMEKHTASAVKVCLERRFNAMAPEPVKLLDLHSAVINKFLSKLQESENALKHFPHPEMQKIVTLDTVNVLEASNSCGEDAFNPIQGICGQAHSYMVGPNKHHQGSFYPNSLAFNLYQERPHPQIHNSSNTGGEYAVTSASIRRDSSTTHLSKLISSTKASKVSAGGSRKEGGRRKPMSDAQRKERHNITERERRRKIRLYHDHLNTLVPFCNADTDKVTTLQWTTAYLEYIKQKYGDVFKEEFTAFASKTTVCPAATYPASKKPNKEVVDNKLRVE